jgi:hypothetical protein
MRIYDLIETQRLATGIQIPNTDAERDEVKKALRHIAQAIQILDSTQVFADVAIELEDLLATFEIYPPYNF